MNKLNRFIDYNICDMLPSNVTIDIPATTTPFVNSLPLLNNLSFAEHISLSNELSDTHTPYAVDDGLFHHKVNIKLSR